MNYKTLITTLLPNIQFTKNQKFYVDTTNNYLFNLPIDSASLISKKFGLYADEKDLAELSLEYSLPRFFIYHLIEKILVSESTINFIKVLNS